MLSSFVFVLFPSIQYHSTNPDPHAAAAAGGGRNGSNNNSNGGKHANGSSTQQTAGRPQPHTGTYTLRYSYQQQQQQQHHANGMLHMGIAFEGPEHGMIGSTSDAGRLM